MRKTPELSYGEGDWLDGPQFVEWLEKRAPASCAFAYAASSGGSSGQMGLHANLGRRLIDWRRGRAANIYTADRYLTALGLHISEIPEGIYRGNPRPDAIKNLRGQKKEPA